ncbi:MAG: hypothetical protein AAF702_44950 [Chloroflexota bacterium]
MNDSLDPLEDRIQRYYSTQSLPPDALVDLKQLISHTEPVLNTPRQWIFVRMKPAAMLAATIVVLLCVSLATFVVRQQTDNRKVEKIAAEIALNHAKQFDSEFFTVSIPSLSQTMPLLDFAPVHPRRLRLQEYNINGARYCTIEDTIAVQVRLADQDQLTYTLYEFRAFDSFRLESERMILIDNIQVTLWQEGEIIMGLAYRVDQI